MKYRKKPVEIEAIQFTRDNFDEIAKFTNGNAKNFSTEKCPNGKCFCEITTLEGVMTATEKDYIIKGVDGEFYPCKPCIFEKTYEKNTEDTIKESGFYKLEDDSYEYICGGKIVFDGETDLDKNESKLIISEAKEYHEIGSSEDYKEDNYNKNKPRTYVIFKNKKSVEAMMYHLELFMKHLK